MKKVIKACFMVFAFLAAIVVFAPKTFARPVPLIVDLDNYVAVTDITINGESRVNVGDSIYLTAVVSPSNATIKKVKWSSSNSDIATVDSNGKVTGQSNGYANIKATINDYEGVRTETKRVQVTNGMVTSVKINGNFGTINGEHYFEMKSGQKEHFVATVLPVYAKNQAVKWSSSDTKVATVTANGYVNALSSGVTTITVTTVDGKKKDTVKVYVDKEVDEWTIMIYLCGNNLESGDDLATSDLKEILSVSNQPNDVNIIIQTGGATKWSPTYGISASYLSRYHVSNKQLVLDDKLENASMGQSSTFQSFLEWGLTEYPAEKTGVIMWNHGGAMRGICFDENYFDDSLLNSEVKQALTDAFTSTARTEKLEFIGYDACLMSVQDVAEFNSQFFNYMIASEESESGYGWDYDTWVDDLYAKKSTTTILKAIVDGFIADNGGVSSSYNNQTLAYLNLAYMSAYKNAWENMAAALANKLTTNNRSDFNELVKSVKYYSNYTIRGVFDALDFVNKLSANSTFNPGSTYTNAVKNAFNNLVGYSSCGRGAGNSNGLCMFWSVDSNCNQSSYYTSSQTNFTNWRSLVSSFGY